MTDPRAWYYRVRFRVESSPVELPQEFVIVTGYATTGERWTDAENAQADARLAREIAAAGWWHLRITGYSIDTGHCEPGWAVQVSADEGQELGLRFRQDAIYVVRGNTLVVRYCATGNEDAVSEHFDELVDAEVVRVA